MSLHTLQKIKPDLDLIKVDIKMINKRTNWAFKNQKKSNRISVQLGLTNIERLSFKKSEIILII